MSTALPIVDSLHGLVRAAPVGPIPVPTVPTTTDEVIERLRAWSQDFAAGQATATLKAVRADWGQYIAWCEGTGHAPLPASPEQLEAFLKNAVVRGRKRSTLKRYVYTVGVIHEAAGLANPAKEARWAPKWAALGKALASRKDAFGKPNNGNVRKQAGQLVANDIDTILATLGTSLRDQRDAAMLLLASDTLLREAELVAVCVEHLQLDRATGRWTLWVPFSKTNQDGDEEDYRYVDRATMQRIRAWQAAAGIEDGVLFRPVGGRPRDAHRDRTGLPALPGTVPLPPADTLLAPIVALKPREVARIFRRRAAAAGLDHAVTISGHSTRIGTANDLINSGFTTAQIQQAGHWKSADMVHAYTRRSQAGSNSVADLRQRKRGSGDGKS